MIINKSLRAKMSLQDGANVKIVEKITRINAKMCGFLWRYSTRLLISHDRSVQKNHATQSFSLPAGKVKRATCKNCYTPTLQKKFECDNTILPDTFMNYHYGHSNQHHFYY